MSVLLIILGVVFSIAGLAAVIIVLVDAFQDAWWKALLMFVPCIGGLYWLYYVFFEYESEYKFGIVALAIFGTSIGGVFFRMALTGHPS